MLHVQFDDASKREYHALWLRHMCHCPQCLDKSSLQWSTLPHLLRPDLTLGMVQQVEDNVMVTWEGDSLKGHEGIFPVRWLQQNGYGREIMKQRAVGARPKPLKGRPSSYNYNDLKEKKEAFKEWLKSIYVDGFAIVRDVPQIHKMVMEVATLIFPPQYNIYADYYDIISETDGVSLAYKLGGLPFHMDLPYYESPAGLQLLHYYNVDSCVTGGENILLDQMYSAEEFRKQFPNDFAVLARVPATFQTIHLSRAIPAYMHYQRPIFQLGYNSEITGVFWNPQIEGPLLAHEEDVGPYYTARWKYANFLEEFHTKHILKLAQRDLLIFNNRRLLHNRKEFELNGGQRHLQGCYINIDEFKSQLYIHCRDDVPHVRVSNQDYIN